MPSLLIPDVSKMTKQEARDWIKTIADIPFFPVISLLYNRGLDGGITKYHFGPNSSIAKLMANDTQAYANSIIRTRLLEGEVNGKNGGTTRWTNLQLKLTINSSSFNWELISFDEESNRATVSVTVIDTFDFNESKKLGTREEYAEKLTAIGRKAELESFKVTVNYIYEFFIILPQEIEK